MSNNSGEHRTTESMDGPRALRPEEHGSALRLIDSAFRPNNPGAMLREYSHVLGLDNIENMRRQLKSLGAIYDWKREIITCLPEYYRWTQWFFLKLYENGLAYHAKAPVNWCSKCQTVLANEQVVGEGVCERCETPVIHRDMEQWFFRITRYADELLEFEGIDWPEPVKIMQRNWIGKSYGTEISFGLEHPGVAESEIKVFTTRPDTAFGVTFMVLAPEHPLVEKLTSPDKKAEVEAYVAKAKRQSEIERLSTEKEKEGVFVVQDGRVEFRPLRLGIAGEEDFEVLSGLQAGEKVVTGPFRILRDLKHDDLIKQVPKKNRTGAD